MLTIAIVNEKGGSGKTTTSVNLAAALGAVNQRILLVDLDGQAAATRWLGVEGDTSFADALWRGEGLQPLKDITPNVDLAPGHAKLDSVAHDLRPTQGGQLRKLLREVEGQYDIAMIDCPPSLGNRLIGNALVAATHAIVPVETSILAMDCMQSLLETIQDVRDGLGHDIELMGILACRFDGRTNLSRSVLTELHRALPGKVLNSIIRENVRLRECPAAGESILTYAPRSTGASDYIYLADEVLSIIDGSWEPQDLTEDTKPRKKKSRRKSKSKSKSGTAKTKTSEETQNKAEEKTQNPVAESNPDTQKTETPQAKEETPSPEPTWQDETPADESSRQDDASSDQPKPVATIEVPDVAEEIDWSEVSFDQSGPAAGTAETNDSPVEAPEIQPAETDWNLDGDPQTAMPTDTADTAEASDGQEDQQHTDQPAAEQEEQTPEPQPAVEELSWSLDGDNPTVASETKQAPANSAGETEETDDSSSELSWDLNAETASAPEVADAPGEDASGSAEQTGFEQPSDEDTDQLQWQMDSAPAGGPQAETVSALDEAAESGKPDAEDDLSFETDTAEGASDADSWDTAPATDGTEDALAETAPNDVPKPAWPTAESEFYRPVLEAIVSLGGTAKEEHVIERIREIMDGRLNEVDLAPPADGRSKLPVWQQTVQKAKRLLTIDGLMKEQRFRRTWKITARGKEAVANQDQQRIYD